MIKRTLYFGNPAYLSLRNSQMIVKLPEGNDDNSEKIVSVPIEDLGFIVIDNSQVLMSQGLTAFLIENNVAIIHCDSKHHPVGMVLPLSGHTLQSERFRHQIDASIPLKKQLWKQTIQAKLSNQASNLERLGIETGNMERWITEVKSGDSSNLEARGAVYYWKMMFGEVYDFTRERFGDYPNNFLNYGYAILRAVIARSLVASGMLPTLGIHHHNRYNAYCLADDIMEPYRPFVDKIVYELFKSNPENTELTKDIKKILLAIPVIDVIIDGHKSPLMVAATTTTASLYKCFTGERRTILYPSIPK